MTSFLRTNPTIQRVVIERSYIKLEFLFIYFSQTLVEMPNLKYLEFNGVADIFKVIYDKFATPEYNGSICLVFRFDKMGLGTPRVEFIIPQEVDQWDKKCSLLRKLKDRHIKISCTDCPTNISKKL